ncbi:MAG: glycogen-binding domain-containing protein [Gemmatimonadota bacterium]
MTLHPDLHRYLDGEIPLEELPEELRREAEAWRSIEALLSEPRPKAPAHVASRVMSEVRRSRPATPPLRWLLAPRPLPPVAIAAAAAIAFFLAFPLARLTTDRGLETAGSASPVYVQFVLQVKDASSVAVAGDFTGWSTERFILRDDDGDGVWTGLFPVPSGIHKYMFVVDGEEWVTDPFAGAYVDDGFGGRNALLEVLPLNGRSL